MDGRTGKLIKAGRVRPSRRGYKSQQRAAGPVDWQKIKRFARTDAQ